MKKVLKSKWMIVILILIAGLAVFLSCRLLQNSKVQKENSTKVDLVIVNDQPIALHDGTLYKYEEENGWTVFEYGEKVKQVFSGEEFCFLDVAGKLYYEANMTLDELAQPGHVPLTTGAYMLLTEKAIALNAEQKFSMVNQNVGSADFRAVLPDGSVLYQEYDDYAVFEMEKEILMISGAFILTADGNVYVLYLNEEKVLNPDAAELDTVIVPELQLVYDGGDITYIDAASSANRCIGLTKDGKAMIWCERVSAPDISEWNDLVMVIHGFNYVAGLTSEGKVLFAHYEEEKTAELADAFAEWENIVDIEDYFEAVYGIDEDGICFKIELVLCQDLVQNKMRGSAS